ncbi:MAG: DAK2 domain-containing protein [Deltaproteobacteria bacterium]|jgi:dihydroxyacetone kinase-like protein|nr:DAK2 domain-containing protein [Deltaproteobacteria bacterium]
MLLGKQQISNMFLAAAALWKANTGRLGDIDARFGDGDHGVTIGKIAALFEARVRDWRDEPIGDFIRGLGEAIMEIGGGSAGPLYGSLIGGMAGALADERGIDGPLLKNMLDASLTEMFELTTARVGAKTMMCAMIPAVEAARAAPGDVAAVLAAAAGAAALGAKNTENRIAKFGRARNYGEQTLGTPDAGAVSTALLFEGFLNGIRQE